MNVASRPDRFCLSKWYLDAVGESGEVFIGYRADLRWRRLEVAHAAALTGGSGEARAGTASTVRPGKEPDFAEGALAWGEPGLDVEAKWRGAAPAVCRTLYESPDGAVVWRCLVPSAQAEIRRGGSVLRGLGYAEHLELTLPPWKLPIDALRWGRFLTLGHSVVWIEWRVESGPPRTWVFFDGREVRGDVSEETVCFEGGRVDLPATGRLVLRSGRLSHLLRNLPGALRTSLPGRLFAFHETKWRTRGCLLPVGSSPEGGWAIHETVRFRP